MSNYLSRLVERHVDTDLPVLQPRIPSRFEDVSRARLDTTFDEEAEATLTTPPTDAARFQETSRQAAANGHESGGVRDQVSVQTLRLQPSDSNIDLGWQRRLAVTEHALKSLSHGGNSFEETPNPVDSNSRSVAPPSLERIVPSLESVHSHHYHSEPQIEAAQIKSALNSDSHASSREVVREIVPSINVDNHKLKLQNPGDGKQEADQTPQRESVPAIRQETMNLPAQKLAPQIATEHRRSEPRIQAPPTIVAESLPRNASENNTVHVSIGRIEIRSPAPKPEPKKTAQPSTQARIMTLDEYVRQRTGGLR